MKVSYKHSEIIYCKASSKCWYPLNTIEGIRIVVILAIELFPMCQIQDWIYLVVQLKFQRFMIWKSTKKNYKYSNSSISLIHYLEDIEYELIYSHNPLKGFITLKDKIYLFCTTNKWSLCMKHIALVYTHIIHRRIMSQLLKDIVLWYYIPLIKHIFIKSVVWTMKFKIWLYEGEHIFIDSTLKLNH